MAAAGDPQESIATLLNVSLPTLHKHYRRELDVGAVAFKRKAVGVLARNMDSQNEFAAGRAAEFYLSRRHPREWSEKSVNVNVDADLKPSERESVREKILGAFANLPEPKPPLLLPALPPPDDVIDVEVLPADDPPRGKASPRRPEPELDDDELLDSFARRGTFGGDLS